MANDCLVTKLKGVVNNNNLKKLGEIFIEVYADKLLKVHWANFDAEKDTIRIVSGSRTIESTTNGYIVATGSSPCIVGVGNKYDINVLNSAGEYPAYVINGDDFENVATKIQTMSRAKVIGNIGNFCNGAVIDWFQCSDWSDAYGNFDMCKAGNVGGFRSLNNKDVMLVASGDFTGGLPEVWDGVFKPSNPPINISNWKINSNINIGLIKGLLFTGNVETDFNPLAVINRINLSGATLTGRLEKVVEKMIPLTPTTSPSNFFRVDSTSAMTFHGQTLNNASLNFNFYSDRVEGQVVGSTDIIATYTKATSTWSYT